jgi:hypothetical protein
MPAATTPASSWRRAVSDGLPATPLGSLPGLDFGTLRYWADFNDTEGYSLVGLAESSVIVPTVGAHIEVFDGEGNTVQAVVTRTRRTGDHTLVYWDADWDTWRDGLRIEVGDA